MLLLAVDTTGPQGSAALLRERDLLAEEDFEAQLNHSEMLLAAVDRLLRAARLGIRDVEGFCVAAGPGSFTGIRIGLATVKGLAFASGGSVAPVSSLLALALRLQSAETEARLLCPMIDAKKGEIYAALFEAGGGGTAEVVPQGAYTPEDFLARLPEKRLIHFIGSGVDVCRDKLLRAFKDSARFSRESLFLAREVGLLGHSLLREGRGVASQDVMPIYFRRSQAEEKH